MSKTRRLHVNLLLMRVFALTALFLPSPSLAVAQAPSSVPADRSQSQDASRKYASASIGSAFRHPLDPLEPAEIEFAVTSIRKRRQLADTVRFVTICLNEPSKAVVRQSQSSSGGTLPREAFLILLDSASGRGYEAVVDLATGDVKRHDALPEGVQPPIMIDEFGECEEAVRRSPVFREAMKKRGINDLSLVMVNAWSAGHYGNEPADDKGKRLVRALCWVRSEPRDNGYARPIENLVAVVDLNRKQLVRLEDYGAMPLPPESGNWAREYQKETHADLKPLDVIQPKGTSFTVQGHEVKWQKWSLRVGFNPREGLLLHTVSYDGRPILYRASVAEMIVPYADPKASSYHKNVFDLGEYGVGMMANSLELGCDCLGSIRYFDGHMADSRGKVVTIKNAICLHEEDAGMLWKHTDWRTSQSDVRRCAPPGHFNGRHGG